MGATASINATSKKYKPSEPIEVKFHNVVKYDDGDEKKCKADGFQLETKKQQPLSLLASAIRILERKPKEHPVPNGYIPSNYARQLRPRSAYVVLKKGSQSSSTLSTTHQNGIPPNGFYPKTSPQQKQYKTKQNLYMSLINPTKLGMKKPMFPRNGMSMPQRLCTPPDNQLNYGQPKSNTLPRYMNTRNDGKRLRLNRRLYMDMIRPVMATPQYLKLGGSKGAPATPSSQRTISRQSQYHQNLSPRPPNESQVLRRLHPNTDLPTPQRERFSRQREIYTPQREMFNHQKRAPTPQRRVRSEHNSSVSNGFVPHKDMHLPRLTRKTKDEVSLNSSLNSRTRGQIPRSHPDNITPLYFRKSVAYSPQYKHKNLLSNPL